MKKLFTKLSTIPLGVKIFILVLLVVIIILSIMLPKRKFTTPRNTSTTFVFDDSTADIIEEEDIIIDAEDIDDMVYSTTPITNNNENNFEEDYTISEEQLNADALIIDKKTISLYTLNYLLGIIFEEDGDTIDYTTIFTEDCLAKINKLSYADIIDEMRTAPSYFVMGEPIQKDTNTITESYTLNGTTTTYTFDIVLDDTNRISEIIFVDKVGDTEDSEVEVEDGDK